MHISQHLTLALCTKPGPFTEWPGKVVLNIRYCTIWDIILHLLGIVVLFSLLSKNCTGNFPSKSPLLPHTDLLIQVIHLQRTFNDKKREVPPQDFIPPLHPSPSAQFATCGSSGFLEAEQRITVFITQNLTLISEYIQNWLCYQTSII